MRHLTREVRYGKNGTVYDGIAILTIKDDGVAWVSLDAYFDPDTYTWIDVTDEERLDADDITSIFGIVLDCDRYTPYLPNPGDELELLEEMEELDESNLVLMDIARRGAGIKSIEKRLYRYDNWVNDICTLRGLGGSLDYNFRRRKNADRGLYSLEGWKGKRKIGVVVKKSFAECCESMSKMALQVL